ncbi:MAG: 1-deoxy-D-xylulose-5-phosphate reductoisomerase [Bacteroidales bacterium]|nr:1-deoxy-D-xylulose-5-phosphate reductoisomerase [Bacteroidales bacterium]
MRTKVAILGSTGSIGTQTLEVIEKYNRYFETELLAANKNADLLIAQARKFMPDKVIIVDDTKYEYVKESLKDLKIKVFAGEQALIDGIDISDCDVVVAAISGFKGLFPLMKAIEKRKRIALSNKETIVVAGSILKNMVEKYKAHIIPVDSEHSAIFQCIIGENPDNIKKIILTASGGPFKDLTKEEISSKTALEALHHPVWHMGSKVTIDSATLMNKGLEVIEAYWLFGVHYSNIDVLIHPQSIIHSMVMFIDGSIKSQLSIPDMKIPILYSLSFPFRMTSDYSSNIFSENTILELYKVDKDKFPCLSLAYEALRIGGNAPCILNSANEVAVDAYLKNLIKFYDIPYIIEKSFEKIPHISDPTIDEIIETDKETRIFVKKLINYE